MNYAAQIFGTLAIGCSLIIYSQNKKRSILVFKCVQDICWLIHYLLLSAFSAAATSMLCIARSATFYGTSRKETKNRLVLCVFLILYSISALLTWKNVFSLLPAVSSCISTVAFWTRDPRHTKILAIMASLFTLGYNIAVAHSASVYVGVSITVVTSTVSLLMRTLKKKDTAE